MERPRRFETRAVHSGEHRAGAKGDRDGIFFPISTPIYASTTFSHPNIETTDRVLGGEEQGYSYARYDNPTVRAFEEALVSLEAPEPERGVRAFAFASGMAATHAAFAAAELTDDATVLAAEQLDGDAAGPGLRRERRRDPLRRRLRPGSGGEEGRRAKASRRNRRVHLQPTPARRRHTGDLEDNPRRGSRPDRGQHLWHPLPPAATRARRGYSRPQRDQVPFGTRRPDGRSGRSRPALRRRRGATTQAGRGRTRPFRGLARRPRPQ